MKPSRCLLSTPARTRMRRSRMRQIRSVPGFFCLDLIPNASERFRFVLQRVVCFGERLFHEMQRGARSVYLEVSAGPIALDGIAPLGNFPFELDLGERHGLGQIHFDAVAGGFDVPDVNQAGKSGGS